MICLSASLPGLGNPSASRVYRLTGITSIVLTASAIDAAGCEANYSHHQCRSLMEKGISAAHVNNEQDDQRAKGDVVAGK